MLPVDDRMIDCAVALFTESLPNDRLALLTPSVGVDAPSWMANVFETPPALAVSVAVAAVPTAVTVDAKLALVAPEATVTEGGTVTAELLLARPTANPPVAAAPFSVNVQLSVPEPVIEPFAQVSPVSTGLAPGAAVNV